MKSYKQHLTLALQERHKAGLFRERQILQSPQGTDIRLNGKKTISFCSNDYLGLANDQDVVAAFREGVDLYGAGSGASHLVSGHQKAHHELEERLADFTGRSRALLFSSGYMANVGVLTTLLDKNSQVYEDRLNHASLLDGGLFSKARFRRYPHLDTGKLDAMLEDSALDSTLIVSDGVFSMDGDLAPLDKLLQICSRKNVQLMIDDAHGFGCLGRTGGGINEYFQQLGVQVDEDNLTVLVGTLGKAFGTSGAFVSGSETLIETLIQFCRPYIYTTAMPAAIAHATLTSLEKVRTEHWRREWLQEMISRFRRHAAELDLELMDSHTPIQAVVLGSAEAAVAASRLLLDQGIFVSAIRPPTVPQGTARLRVTFSAAHSETQFGQLLAAMERLKKIEAENE